jgi:Flp pilus assembly protein TadD
MQRAPDLQPAYLEMGRLYERQGDYPTALTYLDRACDLDASDDQALYHRGICEQRTGNTAQGDKDVKLAQELGQVKTTITSLENRCAAEPQNRDLRLRLARTYRKYGNLEGAMQVFDMCARMSPPDAALQAEMASLRQDIKKYGGVAGERKTGGAPNKVPR